MISERAAFYYALLCTDTTLYPRVVFRKSFALTDEDLSPATLDRLRAHIERYERLAESAAGQDKAFLQILVADARKAVQWLERNDLSWFDAEASIQEYYGVAEEYLLKRLQLDWHRAQPWLVENYPPPFEEADWFAVAGTGGGPTSSIPGIQFLRRHMMPEVVSLATLHENTHHATKGPGGYHRYFDEGIANFLAYTIYFHHTQDLQGVRRFHEFLDELNVLYAYPPMLRTMSSLVQQVGLKGLYRLIQRRVKAPERVDWRGILIDARAGRLQLPAWPDEAPDASLPHAIGDLQPAAERIITIVTFPEKALLTPITYQVFERLCDQGPLPLDAIRAEWKLSSAQLDGVVRELDDHFVWNVQNGTLNLFGHSDFLRNTGILRVQAPETSQLDLAEDRTVKRRSLVPA